MAYVTLARPMNLISQYLSSYVKISVIAAKRESPNGRQFTSSDHRSVRWRRLAFFPFHFLSIKTSMASCPSFPIHWHFQSSPYCLSNDQLARSLWLISTSFVHSFIVYPIRRCPHSPFRSQQQFPTDRSTSRQFYSLNHRTIHICITTQGRKPHKLASKPNKDLKA